MIRPAERLDYAGSTPAEIRPPFETPPAAPRIAAPAAPAQSDKVKLADMIEEIKKAYIDTACVESPRFDAPIQKDVADAQSIGVSGTPSFVIGRTPRAASKASPFVGAQPFSAFDARIKELLPARKTAAQERRGLRPSQGCRLEGPGSPAGSF